MHILLHCLIFLKNSGYHVSFLLKNVGLIFLYFRYQFLYLSGSNGTEHTECVDINECTSGIHTCSVNAQCINNPGSFTCRCNVGFSGDGHNCESKL